LLFVDDHHVLYRPGTKRVLHPVRRSESNPLLADTEPWEGTIAYCSVHRDAATGKCQMWYQAYATDRDTRGSRLCYATSDDGLKWVRPKLGLVEYGGSKENNIVLADPKYGGSVVHDPHDPDLQRRYKSAYFRDGMAVAFSPDGVHWKVHPEMAFDKFSGGRRAQPAFADDPPALQEPLTISDVIDVSRDPVREHWMAYTKTWLDGPDGRTIWRRAVVRTDSKDFIHWSRPQLVAWPDEMDETASRERGTALSGETAGGGTQGIHIHGGPTFFYGGVYFSLLQVIDSAHTGLMPTELAVSRDGYHLKRPFRDTWFIPADGGEQFDSGAIWTNATPIVLDDEIRFYYGAYSGNWKQGLVKKPTGIGLATIPRDRFAGIRPLEEVGQVTLKPISLLGADSIEVNGVANRGAIRVEVLDEIGYRLRGYTKDDAVSIKGDSLRQPARWTQKSLADLPAGRYTLRLHLEGDATVYALKLCRAVTEEDSSPGRLERLVFLSHPYAWELQFARDPGRAQTYRWADFSAADLVAMERKVSTRWPQEVRKLGPTDALIINYFGGRPPDAELEKGPIAPLLQAAREHLGNRYLLLFGTQSKNECGREIRRQLLEKGYTYDPATVAAESWGQSTEGCVVNFAAHFAAGMGLAKGFPMRYDLTFPDAPFAMTGDFLERIALGDSDVSLYLSKSREGRMFAIFFPGVLRDGESNRYVEFAADPASVEFTNKKGEPATVPRVDGMFRLPLYVDGYGQPIYVWAKDIEAAAFEATLAAARVSPRAPESRITSEPGAKVGAQNQ
jgi:hypothetical protein